MISDSKVLFFTGHLRLLAAIAFGLIRGTYTYTYTCVKAHTHTRAANRTICESSRGGPGPCRRAREAGDWVSTGDNTGPEKQYR